MDRLLIYVSEFKFETDLNTLFCFAEAKYNEFLEERLRWQHLNDSMSLLLRATNEGYKKIDLFSNTIKKLDKIYEKDDRSDEEIIEDVLSKFKK